MADSAPDAGTPTAPKTAHWFAAILILVAILMILEGVRLWNATTTAGPTTVRKTSTTTTTTPVSSTTPAKSPSVTAVESTDTTTPGKTVRAAETIPTTLFALGALLLLCGVFYPRIAKVTLPGGAGIELTAEQQAGVVKEAVAQAQATDLPTEPETIAEVYSETVQALRTGEAQAAAAAAPRRGPAAMGRPRRRDVATASPDIVTAAARLAAERVKQRRN